GGFVADDGLRLLVPQYRHGDAAGIGRVGAGVDLVQVIAAIKAVAGRAVLPEERPAMLAHEVVHDIDRDHVLELLQLADDQSAMRPRAGERDIEMVAARFGLETALAALGGLAVPGDPVTELRDRTFETAAAPARVVPLVFPD